MSCVIFNAASCVPRQASAGSEIVWLALIRAAIDGIMPRAFWPCCAISHTLAAGIAVKNLAALAHALNDSTAPVWYFEQDQAYAAFLRRDLFACGESDECVQFSCRCRQSVRRYAAFCYLGLDSQIAIPALLNELHALIPFDQQTFHVGWPRSRDGQFLR